MFRGLPDLRCNASGVLEKLSIPAKKIPDPFNPAYRGVAGGEGGLQQRSMVNLAQLLTIDKGRLQKRLGRLSDAVIERVNEAVRVSLDV